MRRVNIKNLLLKETDADVLDAALAETIVARLKIVSNWLTGELELIESIRGPEENNKLTLTCHLKDGLNKLIK